MMTHVRRVHTRHALSWSVQTDETPIPTVFAERFETKSKRWEEGGAVFYGCSLDHPVEHPRDAYILFLFREVLHTNSRSVLDCFRHMIGRYRLALSQICNTPR